MSTVFLLQIWTLSRGGASKYERINAASWGIFQPSTLPPDSVVRGERSGGSRQTRLSHPRARDRKGRRPSSQVPTIVILQRYLLLCQPFTGDQIKWDIFQWEISIGHLTGGKTLRLHGCKPKVYWQMILSIKQCHEQHQKMQLFHDQKIDPFVVVACFMGPSIPAGFWCQKSCFFAWLCILLPFLPLTANH